MENDLDEYILLRDGYMFAAPIICDIMSVKGRELRDALMASLT